jgi:hypothetical protein
MMSLNHHPKGGVGVRVRPVDSSLAGHPARIHSKRPQTYTNLPCSQGLM